MALPVDRHALCGIRWVHVFEEDTLDGEVYRPATAAIPLSRRPRRQFELREDGTASVFTGGPDDRPVPREATWAETPVGIRIEEAGEPRYWAVVAAHVDRLVLRRR